MVEAPGLRAPQPPASYLPKQLGFYSGPLDSVKDQGFLTAIEAFRVSWLAKCEKGEISIIQCQVWRDRDGDEPKISTMLWTSVSGSLHEELGELMPWD